MKGKRARKRRRRCRNRGFRKRGDSSIINALIDYIKEVEVIDTIGNNGRGKY